jgi:hypothetical protein
MSAMVDVVTRGVKKEIDNVREFLTTPKGVFETVDEIIVDARTTGRELVRTVRPGVLGQRTEIGARVRRLLRR